ncbi:MULTISPECIES: RNA-guided endonuclease InsQ/TnpB family protein [unclassified Arthrobacter]|uniref:RNA-guided endonuclease InsQ/TnpB family protein n=1 Tax=unclassified Arthrobacter TaxID=235627 RepID=UPI001490D1D0|nr:MULTISPECIES: RNA-guided endonuclease TnpB family protein [unclassified Arthrobacter]NOJ64357.1 transposase [Arthrobacter sp. 147(2020)]
MSLKQRMYPTEAQRALMVMHAEHARFVYNLGLEQRSMWTKDKRHFEQKITVYSQGKELTELRQELDWLRAGSSSVQREALRDLDRAFQNFFARRARLPRFRSARDPKSGFAIRDLVLRRINRRWGKVLIPKVGWVKFRLTYPYRDAQQGTSARAVHHNGRWHVSITTPPRPKVPACTGAKVGIDVGVANTVASSDGIFIQAPSWTRGEQRRFLALQRRLARQEKGSKQRARTLAKLAGLRRTLKDRRTNWVEQTTTALARIYDLAAVEDLKIANMVRRPAPRPDPDIPGSFLPNNARAKAGLNRAILASCWRQFTTRLAQKMDVIRVDPRNTSRQCQSCQNIDARNRESQAVFTCMECGHQAHADTNAAQNILDRALITNPGTPGVRTQKPWRRAASTIPSATAQPAQG